MASKRFADAVRGQVAEAVAAGATPLVDAELFPADTGDTAYLAPQVLVDVDHSMRVMTEESFGPVVGIMPVDGDEEAIRLMNDSRYGLTASVWTSDIDKAEELGAPDRDRDGLHEPLRLPRSGADLDRGQGDRAGCGAVAPRVPERDAAEVLSPAAALTMALRGNWNYPTAIRFGAGRIAELGDACRAAGMARPLFVTDPGIVPLPIAAKALDTLKEAGLAAAVFHEVQPNPTEANVEAGIAVMRAAGTTGWSPSAAARRSTAARSSPS